MNLRVLLAVGLIAMVGSLARCDRSDESNPPETEADATLLVPYYEEETKQYGFMNAQGSIAIPARYDWAGRFRQGRAVVVDGDLYGTIDTEGNYVVEPSMQWIGSLLDGSHAFARDSDKIGFISPDGQILMEPLLPSEHGAALHGRYAICLHQGRGLGVYTAEGLAYECRSAIFPIRGEGPLVVQFRPDAEEPERRDRWYLLRDDGTLTAMPADTVHITPFFKKRAVATFPDRIAVIDSTGKELGALADADHGGLFNDDGLAPFRRDGLYGYMDRSGAVAIEPQFLSAGPFSGGLAAVNRPREMVGYIDTTGKFAIAPQFGTARPFHEGRAFAQRSADGVMGFINSSGDFVVTLSSNADYTFTDFGEDGFVYLEHDGLGFYLNRQGQIVGKRLDWKIKRPRYLPDAWFQGTPAEMTEE